MGTVNANYELTMLDTGANSLVSEGGAFSSTAFFKWLQETKNH
jgi:hypothetical protein